MKSLSVIIPAYNASQYLERCLASCMIQPELTYIIIIDDGSTDKTPEIIKLFQSKDRRIISLKHPGGVNKGRSASRNLGIQHADTKWITFCDADDYFLPGRFTAFADLDMRFIDGTYEDVASEYSNSKLEGSMNRITMISKYPEPGELQDYLLKNREERISLIGIIIKKKVIEDIGLFDEELIIGEDTDVIWKSAGAGRLVYLENDTPVVVRQVHEGNTYILDGAIDKLKLLFYKKWENRISSLNVSSDAIYRIQSSYSYYKLSIALSTASHIQKVVLYGRYYIERIFQKTRKII